MMTKMMANQKRILIVEDQADIADFLRRGLNRHGFETVLSENGAQALQLLEQSHAGTEIHLIVSDIQMPVMDGIALALNVARDMPHIPIILMTGYAQQRERAHGLENLVVDILEKPFELAHLVGIINQQFD
ncbi:MAG: response regulator [Hyphomicrobiales bacterium]|nr:response regulator [Hyphomicrobiales bacterium]